MPRIIKIDGNKREVATEEELLDFSNRLRAAGGAEAIPTLLPANKSDPTTCLIARAVNFDCSVAPVWGSGWIMRFPGEFPHDKIREIAAQLGLDTESSLGRLLVLLPEHIGNAALAFDRGLAFKEYVLPDEEEE